MPGQTTVAQPSWVAADAPENATGPTVVAVSGDKKTVFTLTPLLAEEGQKQVAKWLIRKVVGGKVVHKGMANAPGAFAGPPAVLGDTLLVPVSDGFVYRHTPGTGAANPDTFATGPAWVAAAGPDGSVARPSGATCLIVPLSDTAFLTNDGGRKLNRWDWPKSGRWGATAGGWELHERPAGPGVLLPPAGAGEPPRLLIADTTGSVWLYATDRAADPIRRWRPGTGLPAGSPSSPFAVQPNAAGRPVVAYTVEDRFAVCIDPDKPEPRWSVKVGDDVAARFVGPPSPAGNGRWLVSDLGGRVTVIDEGGAKAATLAIGLPGAVPATAAAVVGDVALAPLSDGSAVVLTLPGAASAPPVPEPAEKK
jgi:hypothetical protein